MAGHDLHILLEVLPHVAILGALVSADFNPLCLDFAILWVREDGSVKLVSVDIADVKVGDLVVIHDCDFLTESGLSESFHSSVDSVGANSELEIHRKLIGATIKFEGNCARVEE